MNCIRSVLLATSVVTVYSQTTAPNIEPSDQEVTETSNMPMDQQPSQMNKREVMSSSTQTTQLSEMGSKLYPIGMRLQGTEMDSIAVLGVSRQPLSFSNWNGPQSVMVPPGAPPIAIGMRKAVGKMTDAQMRGSYQPSAQMPDGYRSGVQMPGGYQSTGQMPSGYQSGAQMTGGYQSGGQMTGGYQSGGQMTGGYQSGGQMSSECQSGGQMPSWYQFGGQWPQSDQQQSNYPGNMQMSMMQPYGTTPSSIIYGSSNRQQVTKTNR